MQLSNLEKLSIGSQNSNINIQGNSNSIKKQKI